MYKAYSGTEQTLCAAQPVEKVCLSNHAKAGFFV